MAQYDGLQRFSWLNNTFLNNLSSRSEMVERPFLTGSPFRFHVPVAYKRLVYLRVACQEILLANENDS